MHHSFDINLAKQYGIEEAIIIHHFQHWVAINKRMGKHLIDGKTWTYQTQNWITAHFPYFKNRYKIIRVIDGLVEKGILIKGNFNKKKFDRTVWYAFAEEHKWLIGVEKDPELQEVDEFDKNEQSIVQNRTMESSKTNNGEFESEQPIPDTKTNTKTDKKEIYKEKVSKINFRDNVTLSQDEYDKIKDEYGDWTDRALDILETHKASRGATYKSDYAVFKKGGWLHDKFLAEQNKTITSQAKATQQEDWKLVNSNKDFFMECKQDNPEDEDIQNMYCSGNWLIWPEKSKELSLKMQHEAFKNAFLGMLGVKRED